MFLQRVWLQSAVVERLAVHPEEAALLVRVAAGLGLASAAVAAQRG
jgi:hypothetical protein